VADSPISRIFEALNAFEVPVVSVCRLKRSGESPTNLLIKAFRVSGYELKERGGTARVPF
jgi:hypothetical protein